MNINDKIKQILIDKNYSPSYFADEIGVQRSSISHILSGRNRPSFDIIQKIIRRFPELGYEWIMEEDGQSASATSAVGSSSRYVQPVRTSSPTDQYNAVGTTHRSSAALPGTARSPRHEIAPVAPVDEVADSATQWVQPTAPVQPDAATKKVERILIFYTDGSFKEYTPSAW